MLSSMISCIIISTPHIAHLINLSLKQSTFSNDWKHAIVPPIFTSENHHVASNYRSIAFCQYYQRLLRKFTLNTWQFILTQAILVDTTCSLALEQFIPSEWNLKEKLQSRLNKGVVGPKFIFWTRILVWMSTYLSVYLCVLYTVQQH